MVDSIIDNVVDKDDFSNKKIIKLENYDKLRSEYKKVIQKYNAICEVFDNKNPKSLPADSKINSTIDKLYRDRTPLSYESNSDIEYTFTNTGEIMDPNKPSSAGFDITKGFYLIQAIGAGSGAISYRYSEKYASSSGNAGACCSIVVYFPSNGHITGTIGKGSSGIFLSNISNNNILTAKGEDTEIYFNGNVVVKCMGGSGANIQQEKFIQTEGGKYIDGNYTNKKSGKITLNNDDKDIFIFNGGNSDGGYETRKYECIIVEDLTPFNNYGIGGEAQTDYDKSIATNGQDGYFYIKSLKPSDAGYLNEDIGVESRIIHTIGNENEIRRNFKKALDTIYNKLIPITRLPKDNCVIIGEESHEETIAEKYKDISNNEYYKLSEIKKENNNPIGYFNKDSYILTYDNDMEKGEYILRKLRLRKWVDFINDSMNEDIYTSFINGEEILYVKNIPNKTTLVDVYKLTEDGVFEKQDRQGNYTIYPTQKTGSRIDDIEFPQGELNYTDTKYFTTVSLVGGGAGGAGGSGGNKYQHKGGGGGSGAYLKFNLILNENEKIKLFVGEGGNGGSNGQKWGYPWSAGTPGGDSICFIQHKSNFGDITLYEIATAGGGQCGGAGGKHAGNAGKHGEGGKTNINNIERIYSLLENKDGIGIYGEQIQEGGASVYPYSNFGEGGNGGYPGNWGDKSAPRYGTNGQNGYIELEYRQEDTLYWNNKLYKLYNGVNTLSSIIYHSDYEYDLQKLNRLKEYVASKDNWFDNDGYCQRSCQVNVQPS